MKKLGLVAFAPTLAALAFMAPACGDPAPPTATGGTTSQGGSGQGGGTTTSGGSTQGGMTTQGGATTTSGGATTTSGGSTQGGMATMGGGGSTSMGGSSQGGGGASTMGGTSTTGGASTTGGGGGTVSTGGTLSTGGGGGQKATGGTLGTGGSATGGSATGGSATGGSGGGGDLITTVAKNLDGKMLTGPCTGSTGEATVCTTFLPTNTNRVCPPDKQPPDFALSGELTTNTTVTLGGDTSKTYSITLRVQGVVEAKQYQDGTGDIVDGAVSTKMNGWYVGGKPINGDAYNVYMIRAANPAVDYFLNDLVGPGVSNHTTYLIDYTATIKAQGGSTLQLVAADRNCSMIKNCGPNFSSSCQDPLEFNPAMNPIDPKAAQLNPSFKFETAYNGQWVVLVVTNVTEL